MVWTPDMTKFTYKTTINKTVLSNFLLFYLVDFFRKCT